MKNPLHYQFSEYDCGPTSMMNAIAYLFEREEIPPEAVRKSCATLCYIVWTAIAVKEFPEKVERPALP